MKHKKTLIVFGLVLICAVGFIYILYLYSDKRTGKDSGKPLDPAIVAAIHKTKDIKPVCSERPSMVHYYNIKASGFSPDNTMFATHTVEKVRIWRTSDWKHLFTFHKDTPDFNKVIFLKDHTFIFSEVPEKSGHPIDKVNIRPGKYSELFMHYKPIYSRKENIWLTKDGTKLLLYQFLSKTVDVWDLQLCKRLRSIICRTCRFIPETETLYIQSKDKTIFKYDSLTADPEKINFPGNASLGNVAFSI